jgi:glucose/arabinose dehydrogenase
MIPAPEPVRIDSYSSAVTSRVHGGFGRTTIHRMRAGLVAIATIAACLVATSPRAQNGLRARVALSGLSNPVLYLPDPLSPGVAFVVEQGGRVRVASNGTLQPSDLLDLRDVVLAGGERGLLGLAAAPDGRLFANFTDRQGDTVVARFRRSADPLVADRGSRFDLRFDDPPGSRSIAQPFANHNGGHLAFGPDGYLYIGMGDGGSADDPDHRAQTLSSLLGKMLRIDVNVPDSDTVGYCVPAGNPFAGTPGARPEIWSVGLRNPWRFAFDAPALGGTGALVVADVGQAQYEEVDFEPAGRGGRNYGWRNREGAHNHVTSRPAAFGPLVDPVFEYDHRAGQSISGGVVYRGRSLGPAFAGRYVFADFVQGRVWSIALSQAGDGSAADLIEHTADLSTGDGLGNVSAINADATGELFVVSYSRGVVLQVLGPTTVPAAPVNFRIVRP